MAARTDIQNNSTFLSCLRTIQDASYGSEVRTALINAFSEIAEELDTATGTHATALDAAIVDANTATTNANTVAGQLEAQLNEDTAGTLANRVKGLTTNIGTLTDKAAEINKLVDFIKGQATPEEVEENEDAEYQELVGRIGTIFDAVGEGGSIYENVNSKMDYLCLRKYDRDIYNIQNGRNITIQDDAFKGYDAILLVMQFRDGNVFYKMKKGNDGKDIVGTVTLKSVKGSYSNKAGSANLVTQVVGEWEYADINYWNKRYTGSVLLVDGQANTGIVYAKDGLYVYRTWLYDSETGTITSERPMFMGESSDDVSLNDFYEDRVNWATTLYQSGKKYKIWKNNDNSVKANLVKDSITIEKYRLSNKAKSWHFGVPYLVYGVNGISNGIVNVGEEAPEEKYVIYDPNSANTVISVVDLEPIDTTYWVKTNLWPQIVGHESEWFVNPSNNKLYQK